MESGGGGGGPATGCYKCGRPGHWSRDCPSAPSSENNGEPLHNSTNTTSRPPIPPTQKPKQKAPRRSLPKLTPDLLLSDQGIGHILRYFPRALKCRGRGHEVNDLRHLLGLYAEWHSRFLPYYNFDQFIHKVEQVGATKRVKVCLRELRDRVADGADPTKLLEPHVQQNSSNEQDVQEAPDAPSQFQESAFQNEETSNFQEDMADVIWEKATEDTPRQSLHVENVGPDTSSGGKDESNKEQILNNNSCNQNQISEEQKARMEAHKLKALERAAARSKRSLQI
ncbi:hypothetical protein ACJIZ3_019467 [Penstemon smallii]|uniref:CCHC-type domain-containing protein n=1 Tax=Penstemon smallii TaxID=265156 RepID=A0ABD3T281_9LAMI